MATLISRVQKALEKEFSPKEILLESARRGMVDGWIISKSFEGLSSLERQQKIHKLLDQYFNLKDRQRILTIFTFTPLEKKILIDEDPEGFELPVKKKSVYARKKATTGRRARNGVGNKRHLAANGYVARMR